MFERVAELIEEEFFDEAFLQKRWPALRRDYARRFASSPSDEVVSDLLGELGVSHSLLITPALQGRVESQDFDRNRIRTWRRDDVLLATVRSFKARSMPAADLEAFSGQLDDAKHVVLDLRLNDGGSGGKVCALASLFLPPDTPILRMRDRTGHGLVNPFVVTGFAEEENLDHELEVETLRTHHFVEYRTSRDAAPPYSGKLTVLAGANCYSCGEVFVQALKEHTAAVVLGERTAGFVAGAMEFPLEEGYALMLPFASMESGGGAVLEGVGVAPHVSFEWRDESDEELMTRVLKTRGGAA